MMHEYQQFPSTKCFTALPPGGSGNICRARHLGGAARFREVKNLNHYARILMAGYRERVTLIRSAHLNGLEVHA